MHMRNRKGFTHQNFLKKISGGFTLIELLVVVAIISLLSSIILASLKDARLKAKDTAIKTEVRQLANLMALEYNENNSYFKLQQPNQSNWNDTVDECNGTTSPPIVHFSGTYAANAKQICVNIVTLTGRSDDNTNMHIGNHAGPSGALDNNKFSIMAYLPGTGKYFCMGSSGRSSDTAVSPTWTPAGCYDDP